MGKLKTKKGALKRFKVTPSGKVLFSHQYKKHLNRKKSQKRMRRLSEPGVLTGEFAKKVKRMIGASV